MARNYRKLLSLAVCATMSLSSFAQTWKNVAVNKLNNGKFKEVEQIISDLNTKEQKDNAIFIDSLQTMMGRIRNDFRITPEEGKKELLKKVPNATDAMISEWKKKKYLETRIIDGQEWWFRKTIRNFSLLNKDLYAEQIAADKKKE